MDAKDFCLWLQGFFEISQHLGGDGSLPKEAVEEINNHLKLVFNKVTPAVKVDFPTPVHKPNEMPRVSPRDWVWPPRFGPYSEPLITCSLPDSTLGDSWTSKTIC